MTESPLQLAPALLPKRLLLEAPLALRGTLLPQLVSSAACAMRLTGCTPSCCAACWACGHTWLTKPARSALEADPAAGARAMPEARPASVAAPPAAAFAVAPD